MDTEPGAALRKCAAAAMLVLFDGNVATWCDVGSCCKHTYSCTGGSDEPWALSSGVRQLASWVLQPYLHAARLQPLHVWGMFWSRLRSAKEHAISNFGSGNLLGYKGILNVGYQLRLVVQYQYSTCRAPTHC